ncbi:hypothetical protein M2102_000919, partial [Fusobacterium sp. PH5-7]
VIIMKFKYKIVDLLDKKIIKEVTSFDKAAELLNLYTEKGKKIVGAKYEKVIQYGILRETIY